MSTIYDVARAANVSPKTVSRVLNGDAPVGRETRRAVEKAMAELGYVPSSAARTMRSNRSGLIGLVTGAISLNPEQPSLSGLPDLFIVQGVQKSLEAAGMTLLISDTGGNADRVPSLLRTFVQHRVEGIIFVADYHKQVKLPPLPGETKLVLANCFDAAGTPAIVPDDMQGQRQLVRRMIGEGHRRIAYLTLSRSLVATGLRTEGYRAALEEAGLAFDPALVIEADVTPPDPEAEERLLTRALDQVLALSDPPTAICLGNDRMAVRAYGLLRSRGLELPRDISVAGFDDYRAIAESLYPKLTTAELPYAQIGARAAETLLALIRGEAHSDGTPERVRGRIAWRDSVQPPPATSITISSHGRKTE
ncbi:LacI family DNA-binding transcriptional regulator [Chelativorans intermedius]|uniref:LacI family DNA-binding transcriptional regulator n=1 Tax=Chelativorans intermedius TaxID=515947 RepID=A0ABV6DB70_9HYPH|nr:LacI family DNA-binding transcriptional regulator [Chelativorans intermedius]MCT9000209.1 LacI family DNA-binding transcriptional regulator [Chelativorans intermedius]